MIPSFYVLGEHGSVEFSCGDITVKGEHRLAAKHKKLGEYPFFYLHYCAAVTEWVIFIGALFLKAVGKEFGMGHSITLFCFIMLIN